jgi:hypothetical protein
MADKNKWDAREGRGMLKNGGSGRAGERLDIGYWGISHLFFFYFT